MRYNGEKANFDSWSTGSEGAWGNTTPLEGIARAQASEDRPTETILEWSNLSVWAPGKPILEKLGSGPGEIRQLRRGDLLFLRGTSGSGKTTLIRLCLGILQPGLKVTGLLKYFPPVGEVDGDRDSLKNTELLVQQSTVHWHRFRRLAGPLFGYCPQNPFSRFDTRRTLRHQLAETARLDHWRANPDLLVTGYVGEPWFQMFRSCLTWGERRKVRDDWFVESRYARLLANANLDTHNLGALAHQRSYGFAQRLSMIQIPETLSILFLDEPFNGVDLVTRNRLVDYCIELLKMEQVEAIMCATHDQHLVERFESRMAEAGLRKPGILKLEDRGALTPEGATSSSSESPTSSEAASSPSEAAVPGAPALYQPQAKRLGAEAQHFRRRSKGRHLYVHVPKFPIDADVKIIGITGPSNCGKTSLGRHLCGWEKKGKVSETEQFVPQNPFTSFSSGLPVADSLPGREQVAKVAQSTAREREILPLLELPPSALSGGQLQRLRILGAFATNPQLIFLDEPFAHQDDTWVTTLSDLIRERSGTIRQILVVSHDIPRLTSLCQSIVMFGEFYFSGDKDTVVLSTPVVTAKPSGSLESLIRELEDLVDSRSGGRPGNKATTLETKVNQALGAARSRHKDFNDPTELQKSQAIDRVVKNLEDLVADLRSISTSSGVS